MHRLILFLGCFCCSWQDVRSSGLTLSLTSSPLEEQLQKRLQEWGIDYDGEESEESHRRRSALLGFRRLADGKLNATAAGGKTLRTMEDIYGRQPDFLRGGKSGAWANSISAGGAEFWLRYLSLGLLLKGACILSNVLGQVSPMPSVKEFVASGSTGESNSLPYVTIAFNGTQWCFYSIFAFMVTGNRGFLVVVYANVGGAFLGVCYTAIFHRFCEDPVSLRSLGQYYRVAFVLFA